MVMRKRRPRSNSASASPAGASSSPSGTPSARSNPPLRASAHHSSNATSNTNSSFLRRDSSSSGLHSSVPLSASPDDVFPDPNECAAAPLLDCLTLSQARRPRDMTYTPAGVAAVLYADLISWAVREVAMRYRLRTYLTHARAQLAPPILSRTSAPSHPALHYSEKGVNAECSNCQSNVSASRYAQHLEKCLGRGGRVSSRAASARLKASAERAEREESEEQSNRRRRAGTSDGDSSSKSSKRRRSSPVPGAAVRSGLPPSGRNR